MTKAKKPKFFEQGGFGERLVGVLSDLALYGPGMWAARQARAQQERRQGFEEQDGAINRQIKQLQLDQMRTPLPEIRSVGNELVQFNPATGEATRLYQGKNPAQEYAESLGFAPGSEEYGGAMQDYVLRGNGPTAFGFDTDLEGVRQENRVGMEGIRQGNRAALRSAPTYAQAHPRTGGGGGGRAGRAPSPTGVIGGIVDRYSKGGQLNPRETELLTDWRLRGGRGGRGGTIPGGIPGGRNGPGQAPANQRPKLSLPSGGGATPVKVRTPAEAMALPKGTRFQTPDGAVKVRP